MWGERSPDFLRDSQPQPGELCHHSTGTAGRAWAPARPQAVLAEPTFCTSSATPRILGDFGDRSYGTCDLGSAWAASRSVNLGAWSSTHRPARQWSQWSEWSKLCQEVSAAHHHWPCASPLPRLHGCHRACVAGRAAAAGDLARRRAAARRQSRTRELRGARQRWQPKGPSLRRKHDFNSCYLLWCWFWHVLFLLFFGGLKDTHTHTHDTITIYSTYIRTYIHTYIHAYIHTYIHIYIYIFINIFIHT